MIIVYFLLISAFLLRLVFVLYYQSPAGSLFSDMKNYEVIANSILQGHWNAYHFFQPIGFSLIVAFFKKTFSNWGLWLGSTQAVLSTFSLAIIWDITKKQFGEKIALITLFIGTFHLPWIFLTGFNLSETFFTFLNSVLLWYSWKIYSNDKKQTQFVIIWSTVFMLGFYLKGTNVFLIPLSFLIWIIFRRTQGLVKLVIPSGLIVLSGLLLHGMFTYQKIGKFQLSGSAGGLNFVEGKCPYKWNQDSNGISWYSPIYFQRDRTELTKWPENFTNSSFFMKEGAKCILQNPSTLIMSLESIPLLYVGNTQWPLNQLVFNPWIRLYELVTSFFFIPGLLIGVIFLVREKNEQQLILWIAPIFSLIVCVYIFKSEIRFRIPFDIWIIPVAVFGWVKILTQPKSENLSAQ